MTFLLSGLPARDDVEELTRLIEDAGGTVRREVPPPAPETPPAALDFDAYAPSQDVGAPMRRSSAGRATRVVTPKPGRTLKCLYAAAVGAPMCTPEWVRASLDAGRPLSPASSPPGAMLSRGDEEDDGGFRIGIFEGTVVTLSGDERFLEQFGLLLRHAGAEVIPAEDVVSADGEDVPEGEGPCDYVLVQSGVGVKTEIPAGLARAAKRLGVPCVRHEWAVDSLLDATLRRVADDYRVR